MDPKKTIELLDELEALGFTNEAFHVLHHFGAEATIQRHRAYCEAHDNFQADGNNAVVQRRLSIVLRAYRGGQFRSRTPEIFAALAAAASKEIPTS